MNMLIMRTASTTTNNLKLKYKVVPLIRETVDDGDQRGSMPITVNRLL